MMRIETIVGTPYHAPPPLGKANEVQRNDIHAMSSIQRESTDTSGDVRTTTHDQREARRNQ